MDCLRERISCVRTLTLIERALKVGVINEKKMRIKSTIGTPQGSVMSPVLANIVLHKLDLFIESDVKPDFETGTKRRENPLYTKYSNLRRKSRMDKTSYIERRKALMMLRTLPK